MDAVVRLKQIKAIRNARIIWAIGYTNTRNIFAAVKCGSCRKNIDENVWNEVNNKEYPAFQQFAEKRDLLTSSAAAPQCRGQYLR